MFMAMFSRHRFNNNVAISGDVIIVATCHPVIHGNYSLRDSNVNVVMGVTILSMRSDWFLLLPDKKMAEKQKNRPVSENWSFDD